MAVNMPTAIGAAGTTAFGAQSLVPLILWLAVHYDIKPLPTPEAAYSLALIVIGAGGAIIGSVVWLGSLIGRWFLMRYHIEPLQMEKVDA